MHAFQHVNAPFSSGRVRRRSRTFGHVCPHCAHTQTEVVDVAWVTVRRAEDGKKRYQGRYRDASGAKRTVGTFGTDKAAMQAAVGAEIALAEGTWIDPRAGRITFREYAEKVWLPSRHLEVTTYAAYASNLRIHFIPFFGHYHLGMPRLVDRDFRRASDFFTPANALLALRIKALLPHYRHMARFFDSPRLRAAFTYQDVYMGLSPFSAPSTFSLTPYSELAHGVWYPKGGMYRIVEVLAALAEESGVTFAYDAPVRRIEIEGGRASGVVVGDDRLLPADVVVANADLPYVYRRLLPDRAAAEAMGRKTFSGSTISFFWGLDRVYPELRPHTLFLGDAYRDNFDRIERNLPLPDGPSVYVHAPARLDPGTAPAGKDTLIAVVPTGHMNYDGDDPERMAREAEMWVAARDRARAAVLARLAQVGLPDVADHITVEATATPPTWRAHHNLERGATHISASRG